MMEKLKQLGMRVIGLNKSENLFKSARLKLDIVSAFFLIIFLAFFSYFIFIFLMADINSLMGGQFAGDIDENALFQTLSEFFVSRLTTISLILFFIVMLILDYFVKKMLKPIEYFSNQQKNFTEEVSHELRTPLTVLNIHGEILKGIGHDTGIMQVKESSEIILQEIKGMKFLIEDLLFEARLKYGEGNTGKIYVRDIGEIVKELFKRFEYAKKDGVNLVYRQNFSSKEFGNYYFNGKFIHFTRLLDNLISNAVKNTESGEVKVVFDIVDNALSLQVVDTGVGIEEEKLEKIFDRFYAGVGLSIVKNIVEKNNWEIKIGSVVGQGTTVNVSNIALFT